MKRKYSVGDIVWLRDSLNFFSKGRVEKVTRQRYYIRDLYTNKLESYHWYFNTLTPNYSTTGYDKYIDTLVTKETQNNNS